MEDVLPRGPARNPEDDPPSYEDAVEDVEVLDSHDMPVPTVTSPAGLALFAVESICRETRTLVWGKKAAQGWDGSTTAEVGRTQILRGFQVPIALFA